MAKKKRPTPRRVERPQPHAAPKRSSLLVALIAITGAVIAATVVAVMRGGNDGDGPAIRDLLAPSDPGPIHVHGLGINPADKALFIATHTGTYRVAPNAEQATRVGGSRQDTMGFTVVGPNRFLGSGHPDPQAMREQKLPPNLGLIESTDGGRTWTPISLLGQADFHVLRSNGRRIYGVDASNARLMLSPDRGQTWIEREPPTALLDLAVDPAQPKRLLASGEGGVFASTVGGRAWRQISGAVGLLAWPEPNRLYLVDRVGGVHRSGDGGTSWASVGNIGGQPAAFLAQTAQELYVALHDGTVKRSGDGGRTWSVRSAP